MSVVDTERIYQTLYDKLMEQPTQLVSAPEDFSAWTDLVVGTVGLTAGQSDPYSGTDAYLLDSNGAPGQLDLIGLDVPFAQDGLRSGLIHLKAGTATQTDIVVFDEDAVALRHRIRATWSGGVPTLSTVLGGGGLLIPVKITGTTWYRTGFKAAGVIAANVNQFLVYPDTSGGNGTVSVYGANAWDLTTPHQYVGSSVDRTLKGRLTGGLWVAQPPENASYPYGIMRLVNRQTRGEYAGERDALDLELTFYGRHRGEQAAVEGIADLADEALLRYVDASDGLLFSRERLRDTVPLASPPAERNVVAVRCLYSLVVWPVNLTQYALEG